MTRCLLCGGEGWHTNARDEPEQCRGCLAQGICPICGKPLPRRPHNKERWCGNCGADLYDPLHGKRDPDAKNPV